MVLGQLGQLGCAVEHATSAEKVSKRDLRKLDLDFFSHLNAGQD
jgi:hypothetical protein